MIRDTCRYCASQLDEHGKPIGEAGRLPPDGAELCFACGSIAAKAADAARHCGCPRCAEREFQRWPIPRDTIDFV